MRLGIVSDTHGHIENCRPAVHMLESMEVDAVLHCGDVGSGEVLAQFAQWPVHFVLGNCDDPRTPWLKDQRPGSVITGHEKFGDLTLGNRRIALLHSDDYRKFQSVISSGEYDLVCYGHTHVAKKEIVGKTLVLNPGALYRASRYSIAVYETATGEAEILWL